MPVPRNRIARSRAERAAAWIYTGPLGHLWSALADIVVLWGRFAARRLRARASSSPADSN